MSIPCEDNLQVSEYDEGIHLDSVGHSRSGLESYTVLQAVCLSKHPKQNST